MTIMKDNSLARSSNIEACRIYSMLLIVLLHSTWSSLGYPTALGANGVVIALFYALSIVGVNVFILITGWFSINLKYRSVVNLLWILFFYGIIRICISLYNHSFNLEQLLFVSKSNWFIVSYIGLMIISPFLNTGILNIPRRLFGLAILLFLLYGVWFNIFPARATIPPGFNNGCSVIWFVEMYLIGRYLRIYGCPSWVQKYSYLIYVTQVIIVLAMTIIAFLIITEDKIPTVIGYIGAQNNPIIVIGAIAVFYTFLNFKIQSKIINRIAMSTLAVLIVHTTVINTHMKDFFKVLFYNETGVKLIIFWFLGVVVIYTIAVLIDQLRIIIYDKVLCKFIN